MLEEAGKLVALGSSLLRMMEEMKKSEDVFAADDFRKEWRQKIELNKAQIERITVEAKAQSNHVQKIMNLHVSQVQENALKEAQAKVEQVERLHPQLDQVRDDAKFIIELLFQQFQMVYGIVVHDAEESSELILVEGQLGDPS